MSKVTVTGLLRDGRIEKVNTDVRTAWLRLDEAKTHPVSSAALTASDPTLAYVALHDASRKVIAAQMQARGYRVTN